MIVRQTKFKRGGSLRLKSRDMSERIANYHVHPIRPTGSLDLNAFVIRPEEMILDQAKGTHGLHSINCRFNKRNELFTFTN